MSDNKRIAWIVAAVIIVIFPACANKKIEETSSSSIAIVPVKVAPIKTGTMDETVQASGQTEALRVESLISPVTGRITRLAGQEGSAVMSGDTLAVILPRESISALEGAQALLDKAKTTAEKTEAERAMKLVQANQNPVVVKSQINGVVAARNVTEGTMVADGAALLEVVDPTSIDFAAQVSLDKLDLIAIGQNADIILTALPDEKLKATVKAINPQADTANQTIRVLLHLNNVTDPRGFRIKNGMAGTAQIIVGEHRDAMIVPLSAVLRDDENDTYAIVTITSDSLSETVSITPGITQDSLMEISSPNLHAGMPIIIEGNYALPDSTRVSVK